MLIDRALLRKLPLADAAQAVTSTPMDHMPLLIVDRCLAGAEAKIAEVTVASYSSGIHVAAETLTMPRAGFGPRPINVIAPTSRSLYGALAARLRTDLPAESRTPENWAEFSAMGLDESEDSYVVELDIASCYEYIDHPRLLEELLLQTTDIEVIDVTIAFLGEVFGRARGLPQLIGSSDLLSDTYLHGIQRALLRSGFETVRYADDFKVLAPTWGRANDVIESAADIARDFGLVLSSAKTNVRKVSTIRAQRERLNRFFLEYFNEARADLTLSTTIFNIYDQADELEIEPTEEAAYEEAFWRILREWKEATPDDDLPFHSSHLPFALTYLRNANQRIDDETLRQIVFRTPMHLRAVLNYLVARPETSENWTSLTSLVAMERQSPWAKLWLLRSAQSMPVPPGTDYSEVERWGRTQLAERHESVRAESAWLLARLVSLTEEDLKLLAASASRISRPALAASASAREMSGSFAKSLKTESPLNRKAAEWGAGYAP